MENNPNDHDEGEYLSPKELGQTNSGLLKIIAVIFVLGVIVRLICYFGYGQ